MIRGDVMGDVLRTRAGRAPHRANLRCFGGSRACRYRKEELMEVMWDQIADDMGWHDADMSRARPYNGQPHTGMGQRGATEIQGVTFRDLRDCFVRAYCLSLGGTTVRNQAHYEEALKGERAALCENDLYGLDGEPDPMAVCQNLSCEIERLMGIFPNVPGLSETPETPHGMH